MKLFTAAVMAVALTAPLATASETRAIKEPELLVSKIISGKEFRDSSARTIRLRVVRAEQLIEKTLLPALRSRIIQDSKTWHQQGQRALLSNDQLATPIKPNANTPA